MGLYPIIRMDSYAGGNNSNLSRRRQPLNEMSRTRVNQVSPVNIPNAPQQPIVVRGFIFDYCENTTVHGMRYIAERDRHWTERVLWSVLCMMAATGSVYLSMLIWKRFDNSPTVSVIESTNFPISNIPFPAVTICDANRVHWSKAQMFRERYLPEASNETIGKFYEFLKVMALVEFGDFDLIGQKFNNTIITPELTALNISQLMLDVMPKCQEFFSIEECWWRNAFYNCCEIFELQRTEYGYCYAFNSEVSEVSTGARHWYDSSSHYLELPPVAKSNDKDMEIRPRRTSSYGPWGGLRFTMATSDDLPPDSRIVPGIILMVNSPTEFPENGRVIPSGQSVFIDIDAQVTYTMDRVHKLSVADRDCLYYYEGDNMQLGGYLFHNCMIECHRNYTVQYCNCTPYFFYSYKDNVATCNMSSYLCLSHYNPIFNYHKPAGHNPFFDNNVEGMKCNCQPDCSYPQFSTVMSMSPLTQGADEEDSITRIFLDIHFQNPAMVRYRTDVIYSWLDLVVAFGGIAGLCLGCSLLSGAEMVYYLTVRLYRHYKLMKKLQPFTKSHSNLKKRLGPRNLQILSPQSLNLAFIRASESR